MTTSQLCRFLKEAQYGDVLNKEVEWVFHNEAAKVFMTWLCSSLHSPNHVLQSAELKAYGSVVIFEA